MEVKISETGERKTLAAIDPILNVDYTRDLIGNTGAFNDGQFFREKDADGEEILDYFVCSAETFDWWDKVIDNYNAASLAKKEAKTLDFWNDQHEDAFDNIDSSDMELHSEQVRQFAEGVLNEGKALEQGVTFKTIVEGVEDNNSINNARWSDWSDASDIFDVYGPLADEDISLERATAVLDRAIASDGLSLAHDLAKIQLEVQGNNFAGSWWYRDNDNKLSEFRANLAADIGKTAAELGIEKITNDLDAVIEADKGPARGLYIGKVLAVDEDRGVAFQEVGQRQGAVLPLAALEGAPLVVGEVATISFRDGRGVVASKNQEQSKGLGR